MGRGFSVVHRYELTAIFRHYAFGRDAFDKIGTGYGSSLQETDFTVHEILDPTLFAKLSPDTTSQLETVATEHVLRTDNQCLLFC